MSIQQEQNPQVQGEKVERGLFLRSLFQDRLPSDQHFRSPVASRVRWFRKTLRIAMASWYLLGVALAGWILFTFYQNYQAFQVVRLPTSINTSPRDSLQSLVQLQQQIHEVEQKNRSLIVSRFGFNQSLHLEESLKQGFAELFTQKIQPSEQLIIGTRTDPANKIDAEARQRYVQFLTGQIMLVKDALAGETFAAERYQQLTGGAWQQTDLALSATTIGSLYHSQIQWSVKKTAWPGRKQSYLSLLEAELLNSEINPDWLWSSPAVSVLSINLNDLWVQFPHANQAHVNGAFTEAGRQQVQAFLMQLLGAFPEEGPRLHNFQTKFWNAYWSAFFSSWEKFTENFLAAGELIALQPGSLPLGLEVTRQDGPYWRLFERISHEMQGLSKEISRPAWVRQLLRLAVSRDIYLDKTERETGGLVGKWDALKGALGRKGETLVGAKPDIATAQQGQLVELWKAYLSDLLALSPASIRSEQRIDQFKVFFQGEGQGEPSAFQTGFENSRKLIIISQDTDATIAGRLVSGPLDFMLRVSAVETGAYLQQAWQEHVLAPLVKTDTPGQLSVLFGQPDGLVNKFLDENAGFYLLRNENGYLPRTTLGLSFPFREDFLRFLGSGSISTRDFQEKYEVEVATLPLDVNSGSTVRPYIARLEMQCAKGKTILENWNYPDQKQFIWSPADCGAFRLSLEFAGNVRLWRDYPGVLGFPQFLSEMREGRQTLELEAFHGDKEPLAARGLKQITIAYQIKGESAVIKWLEQVPLQIPQTLLGSFDRRKIMPEVTFALGRFPAPGAQQPTLVGGSGKEVVSPSDRSKNLQVRSIPLKEPDPSEVQDGWVLLQPKTNWTLRLMSLKSEQLLRQVLTETKTPYPLYWFQKADKRGVWHVIICGSFVTREEAEKALEQLPIKLRAESLPQRFEQLHFVSDPSGLDPNREEFPQNTLLP